MLKITDEMREAARQLLLGRHDASDIVKLKAIADGKRKLVDHSWWKQFFADIDRAKLAKIAAMADPARNDKEHERAVAAAKLASFKARRAPGLPPEPPPIDWSFDAMMRRREQVKEQRRKKRKASRSSQPSHRPTSDSVAAAPGSGSTRFEIARLEKPYKGIGIFSSEGQWHMIRGQVSDAQSDKEYPSLEAIHAAIDKMLTPSRRRRSDSVAPPDVPDSVAGPAPAKPTSDSVAGIRASNKWRAAKRAAARAGLKCQTCGKPLVAQRATARFCNVTCRSQAWRKKSAL